MSSSSPLPLSATATASAPCRGRSAALAPVPAAPSARPRALVEAVGAASVAGAADAVDRGDTLSPSGAAGARDASEVAAATGGAAGPVRHLRLVTGGRTDVEGPSRPAAVVELPVGLARRPGLPRSVRAAGASPEELAPMHPAVRARRRRELEAASRRAAVRREAGGGSAADSSVGVSSCLPVALRRLFMAGALVLALVLAVAVGIVATGIERDPGPTTTATVRSGQSLWDVAAATGNADVDATMTRIAELNDLDSSELEAGRVLVVPAQ